MGVKSFVCPRQGVEKTVRPYKGGNEPQNLQKKAFKKEKMDDSALENIHIPNLEGKVA
jgi:hypothetical protein